MKRRFAYAASALLATTFLAAPALAADPPWPDPVAEHVRPALTLGLTHGPILGRPAATSMRGWIRTAKGEGVGYQYVAYDAPQVVVRFHDGHTGRLKYAEGISTLDVGGKREKKQKEEKEKKEKKKRADVPSTAKRVEGAVGGREGAAR